MARPCPKCKSGTYQHRTCDGAANPIIEERCVICGWSTTRPYSPPMTRPVLKRDFTNLAESACTVAGCTGVFAIATSRYKMCSSCSLQHRRWIEKVKAGNMTLEPPFVGCEDGTWKPNR